MSYIKIHKSQIEGLEGISYQTLTAGDNVQISGSNVISATNTTYVLISESDLEGGISNNVRLISAKLLNDWLNGKNYTPDAPGDGVTYARKDKAWVDVSTAVSGQNLQQVTDAGNTTTKDIISTSPLISEDIVKMSSGSGNRGFYHGISDVDAAQFHKGGITSFRAEQGGTTSEILFPTDNIGHLPSFLPRSVNGVVADDKGNVKLPAIKGADFNITGSQYVPFWSGTDWTNNGLKADFTPTVGSLALRDSNASVQTAAAVSPNHAVNLKQLQDITIPRVIFLEEDTYITMDNNLAMETIIIIGGDSSASEIYIYGDVLNEGKKVKVVNYTLNSLGFNPNSFDVIKNGNPVYEIKPQLTYNFIVANQDNQAYLLLIGIENLE